MNGEKTKRIDRLVEILTNASRVYYQNDGEIMPDREYDALYDELAALEAETGYSPDGSPTKNVGHTVISSLEKVTHASPMLSLDKTKDEAKLSSFLSDREGILSWKLDGLAIELAYNNGVFERAVTRGNGYVGEDISHNARFFINLPKKISFAGRLAIRGEAVILFKDFEKINASLPEGQKYKNPRNLCSGTVRQLDSRISASRPVHFFAYSVREAENISFETKSEYLDFLTNLGFSAVKHEKVTSGDVAAAVERFRDSAPSEAFATDGLVLTFNDISYGKSLGETSKFPRDSVAFKWSDETSETALITVEWSTSRTGLINPVAVFEPVEIEGTTVERASLHNVSVFEAHRLGPGDTLLVYKANMIIPQIAENLTGSATLKPPESCPVCGRPSEIAVSGGTSQLYCTNPNCMARLILTVSHYASRDAMNIEGLSEQTIEKFAALGFLANYADIYRLYLHEDEIISMKGFGQKSFLKLTGAIERSKSCRLHNFIYGLGINNVGLANAKLLCSSFGNDIERIANATTDELTALPGFGPVIAGSLSAYFADENNLKIMYDALSYLNVEKPAADVRQNAPALSGKTLVITGDTMHFENRKELQELIEKKGGRVSSSVSVKTSYLINNDNTSASQKNKKARELGVAIITEDELLSMINNSFD